MLFGVIWVAGCGLLPSTDAQPAVDPQNRTECVAPLAFSGETTLAALGLCDLPGGAGDANRPATIRVTQETVAWEDFAPPGVPPAVPEGQLLCVTWADGSGMTTLLHEPFNPPLDRLAAPAPESARPPVVPLVAVAALVVVAAVSWLAFRREGG